jgi:PAS domain S-box-containing protein
LIRDISDRRERLALFENLHEGSRKLMNAETVTEVAVTAAGVIGTHFDAATTGVRLLRDGALEVVAVETGDARLDELRPSYPVGDGFVGEAYERGEPVIVDDVRDVDTVRGYESVRSALLLPIDGYGMITITATEPGAFDETDLELGRLFVADVTAAFERADREERLRERKSDLESYETLVETIGDGVYMTDGDNRITMVNDAIVEMFDGDREDFIGHSVDEFSHLDAAEVDRHRQELLSNDTTVATIEDVVERPDGQVLYVENRFSLLPSEDSFRGTVGVVRNITDRKEREELVRALHDVSQELMAAETKDAVAERTAAAAEQLGFETVGVRLLDETGQSLEITAQETNDDRLLRKRMPTYGVDEGFVGDVYEQGDPVIIDDLREIDLKYDPEPARSALLFPIEGHGMIVIASTEPGAFDETDLELGRLFAADVESAFERADREERLREGKARLKTQRDEL